MPKNKQQVRAVFDLLKESSRSITVPIESNIKGLTGINKLSSIDTIPCGLPYFNWLLKTHSEMYFSEPLK